MIGVKLQHGLILSLSIMILFGVQILSREYVSSVGTHGDIQEMGLNAKKLSVILIFMATGAIH